MSELGFCIFDTALGACGVAWGDRGLVGVQLPEGDADATRARLRRRFPAAVEGAAPTEVGRAIEGIVALLSGAATDFADVALDMGAVSPFERQVYDIALSIPAGQTLTYGEVAARTGREGFEAARAVGQALGRNPFPIIVPCHRVLAAGGKVGGFSANGGVTTKRKLLAIESVHARGEPSLFDFMRPD